MLSLQWNKQNQRKSGTEQTIKALSKYHVSLNVGLIEDYQKILTSDF